MRRGVQRSVRRTSQRRDPHFNRHEPKPALDSQIQRRKIAAVHWSDIGIPDATDFEILSYASAHNFIVLTADLDFSAILAATRFSGPSVIQLRFDVLNPDILVPVIVMALQQFEAEMKKGAVLSIDMTRNRVRLLPLF